MNGDLFAVFGIALRVDAVVKRVAIVHHRKTLFQIARVARRTVKRQVGWGGAADPVQIEQAPGDQAGVGQRTAADHAVGAVADQIDHAVADAQIDLYLRIACQKVGQCRQQ